MELNTVFGFTKTVNRRNRCNLSFSLYFRSHRACMLSAFEPLFETVGPHCVYKVSISDGEMYERSAECPLSASKTQRSVLFKLLTYFMDTNLISAQCESLLQFLSSARRFTGTRDGGVGRTPHHVTY